MDVLNITKITIAWEMYGSGIPKAHIASKLQLTRETVHLWIKGIEESGLLEFLDNYTNAKKGSRENRKIDGLLKVRIYKLREGRNIGIVVARKSGNFCLMSMESHSPQLPSTKSWEKNISSGVNGRKTN